MFPFSDHPPPASSPWPHIPHRGHRKGEDIEKRLDSSKKKKTFNPSPTVAKKNLVHRPSTSNPPTQPTTQPSVLLLSTNRPNSTLPKAATCAPSPPQSSWHGLKITINRSHYRKSSLPRRCTNNGISPTSPCTRDPHDPKVMPNQPKARARPQPSAHPQFTRDSPQGRLCPVAGLPWSTTLQHTGLKGHH